jgi:hypothetical protein
MMAPSLKEVRGMKGRSGGLRVVAITFVAVVLAIGVRAQAPKGLLGTWKLNSAKSKFSPGPPPKSMTVTYSAAGDGVKIVVDMVPAEGAAEHWEMTASYDGKDHPVTGNPAADTISMKQISDTKGESTFKKGGTVMAVNTRTLSADGKTLSIESKGTTVDGKPRHDTAVYEK